MKSGFSADNHTITLSATDAHEITGTASVRITVTGDNGVSKPEICPLTALAGANTPVLHTLRRFRDTVLSRTAPGRFIIRHYYLQGSRMLLLYGHVSGRTKT